MVRAAKSKIAKKEKSDRLYQAILTLDTLRIMESHLLVRKYDGFLAHGTLRGRHG